MVTTNQTTNSLIQKLTTKQKDEGISDRIFASRLNITRSLWTQTKSGARSIGFALLKGIVQIYPELIPEVINFLRNEHEPE